ncbi:protein FAM166B [Hemicordylus capensis]|uniref:protein FAM166B n=1 Tax=Hemicordylus capensis TaxID=884348 RepID=UPI002304759A|nr:protein FAM166B [Hemicordylus capensis]
MATAFAPKVSQLLMTPEPHYIPGYGGHCPHYKFTLGQSYGKLTSQLLTSPEVVRSGQLLLQARRCCPQEREAEGSGGGPAAPFGRHMIPGYTGFIPRAQNHFAKSFSKIAKEARSELARQLGRGAVAAAEAPLQPLRPADSKVGGGSRNVSHGPPPPHPLPLLCQQLLTAKYQTPLEAVPSTNAPRQVPRRAFKPQGSPYAMEDSNPQKYFIPGFTGFIPRAQYLIGASYPVITHRALVEFGQMLRRAGPEPSGSPQGRRALPPLAKTYPTNRGLLPHYKGYVPGYKFQFGHTYGCLTCNALGRSTLEKQAQEALLP